MIFTFLQMSPAIYVCFHIWIVWAQYSLFIVSYLCHVTLFSPASLPPPLSLQSSSLPAVSLYALHCFLPNKQRVGVSQFIKKKYKFQHAQLRAPAHGDMGMDSIAGELYRVFHSLWCDALQTTCMICTASYILIYALSSLFPLFNHPPSSSPSYTVFLLSFFQFSSFCLLSSLVCRLISHLLP